VKKYYSKFDVAVGSFTGIAIRRCLLRPHCHSTCASTSSLPHASCYQDGKRVFWDIHHPEKTFVIDLHDERYNELIVEVDDPEMAVKLIQNAL
jgi:hypothetical protein